MPHHHQPNKRYCPNCYYPMAEDDHFCGHCGQKYTDGKVTVGQLIRDFFESVFNLDARLLLTLRDLFRPGILTQAYFAGQHKRYVAPVRLFFVMAVIHFAVLSYVGFGELENLVVSWNQSTVETAHLAGFRNQLDSAMTEVEQKFDQNPIVVRALDSLDQTLPDARDDSLTLNYPVHDRDSGWTNANISYSIEQLIEAPVDSLVAESKAEDFISKVLLRQIIRLIREGGDFTHFALGKLIWMVVLMMPALALLLKLLYIRREHYYVEHLVFSFHYHAFAFLIFSVAFLLENWSWLRQQFDTEWLPGIAFIWLLFYLYRAMRRFYRQGWFKTIVKYSIINFSYLFIFTVFLVLTFIISALLY